MTASTMHAFGDKSAAVWRVEVSGPDGEGLWLVAAYGRNDDLVESSLCACEGEAEAQRRAYYATILEVSP